MLGWGAFTPATAVALIAIAISSAAQAQSVLTEFTTTCIAPLQLWEAPATDGLTIVDAESIGFRPGGTYYATPEGNSYLRVFRAGDQLDCTAYPRTAQAQAFAAEEVADALQEAKLMARPDCTQTGSDGSQLLYWSQIWVLVYARFNADGQLHSLGAKQASYPLDCR